jgi:hypothetical protein
MRKARLLVGLVTAIAAGLLSAVPAQAGWIAYANGGKDLMGYAVGYPDGAAAANAALAGCGGSECRLVLVVEAQCAAYSNRVNQMSGQVEGFWFAYGNNLNGTRENVERWCAEGNDGLFCHLRHASCQ